MLYFQKCLEILCFTPEKIAQIYKLIATILKLGNLIFISTTNIDGTEGCSIMNDRSNYNHLPPNYFRRGQIIVARSRINPWMIENIRSG